MKSYGTGLKRTFEGRDIANFAREEKGNEVAIKLLMRKEPIEEIMYLTDLSRDQVNKLLSQLPKS